MPNANAVQRSLAAHDNAIGRAAVRFGYYDRPVTSYVEDVYVRGGGASEWLPLEQTAAEQRQNLRHKHGLYIRKDAHTIDLVRTAQEGMPSEVDTPLNDIIHSAPATEQVIHLFRGMSLPESSSQIAAFTHVGATVTHFERGSTREKDKPMVSTSLNSSVAARYAEIEEEGMQGIVLHFVLPPGYPMLAVGDVHGDFVRENEVMLPTRSLDGRPHVFTVTRVQKGARVTIKGERQEVTVVTLQPTLPALAAEPTVGGGARAP